MLNRLILITSPIFLGYLLLFLGCGGSRETVRPDSTPVTEEQVPQQVKDEPAEKTDEPETPAAEADIQPPKPVILRSIRFDYDKSDLTAEARTMLAENARLLQESQGIYVRIEGHCDERGTVEYNLALGERRAIATRNYLINYGISPGRITIISYGKERPIDQRSMPDAWAKNRRAEFVNLTQ